MIPTVTVSADKNPEYDTDPGNATKDRVFLLSIVEAEKYFTSDEARKCIPTEYALSCGAAPSDDGQTKGGEDTCYWWLRSPGYYQYDAAFVCIDGDIDEHGCGVDRDDYAVRPEMWISIDG